MANLGAFETMGAVAGALPLWQRHLTRLRDAAERLGIPFGPPAADLQQQAGRVLQQAGEPDGILRLTLHASGRVAFAARARRNIRGPLRLHIVQVQRDPEDVTARWKCTDRSFYEGPQLQSAALGADDALLVDAQGRVLETTTCNVFVELPDGRLLTPALQAPILPGVARALLLEGCAARGLPVCEQEVTLRDLEGGAALWVTNAVYGPRPALGLGQTPPTRRAARPLVEIWAQALRSAPQAGLRGG